MTEAEKIRKELEELSPSLAKLKGDKEGFVVPENYFATLTDNVMAQVPVRPATTPETIPAPSAWQERLWEAIGSFLKPGFALGVFATVALVVIALLYLPTPANTPTGELSGLSEAELRAYIDSNIDEFSLEMIVGAADPKMEEGLFPILPESNEEMDALIDDLLDEMDISDLEEVF